MFLHIYLILLIFISILLLLFISNLKLLFILNIVILQYTMMYRILRKQLTSKSSLDLNKPLLNQSQLIQLISRMIKNIKKKQNIYDCMILQKLRKNKQIYSDSDNFMIIQYEKSIKQMKQLQESFLKYKNESFYASKNYLYTVFMRTSEIIEMSKQKCLVQGKKDVSTIFQNIKQELKQIYLNQSYQQKYEISHIFNYINKNQQTRINSLIKRPFQDSLMFKRQRIILQKLKYSPFQGLKKAQSTQLIKKKEFVIDEIISKKINFELATQKRMKQRQHLRLRKNIIRNYDIMQIKGMVLQNFNGDNQQQIMLDRNLMIKQSIKRYQKRYLQYKLSRSIK